ncbi:MAG: LysR family transcriptional regulator [Acidobacteria bacterium]|nr:LysR family transcriptional regulator [Acidobacteriota bacterium]
MDLRHLQTFQAVLREGSFLKAARSLGLAQPTVSLHIQELEKELGLELFDRSGRERVKTPAGELLAGRALSILDAVEVLSRSMAELKDGKAGLLRLGAIEPAASRRLVPLLGRLRAQRPGLRIRLEVGGTGVVSRAVGDAEIDLGICSAPPAELGLRFEPLFPEEMALLVPRSHRFAGLRALSAAHLEGEPLLLSGQGCAYRAAVEAALQERGVRPQWALECGSAESLLAAVRAGLGIAFLPRQSVSPPPAKTVTRRLRDVSVALPVGLVTRPQAPPPSRLMDILTASLRASVAASLHH